MSMSPMLLGAGLACALGGALAGNALGSTQPLDRSTITMLYQQHESGNGKRGPREPLPDHYPLVTRSGTIPVAELSTRGLYSQARYRALMYAAAYTPGEDVYEEYQPGAEWRDEATRQALAMNEPTPRPDQADPAQTAQPEPLQLAGGPATVEGEGRAKLIDVNASLAMN